jgi:hypothetical protein
MKVLPRLCLLPPDAFVFVFHRVAGSPSCLPKKATSTNKHASICNKSNKHLLLCMYVYVCVCVCVCVCACVYVCIKTHEQTHLHLDEWGLLAALGTLPCSALMRPGGDQIHNIWLCSCALYPQDTRPATKVQSGHRQKADTDQRSRKFWASPVLAVRKRTHIKA